MLSWACRRFRARFAPGSAHPHRRACRQCDAFAAAVEQAAGARLPLPAGLRGRLSALVAPASGTVLAFPVPQLPLPATTAARLRSLAPAARRPAPPEWVRSPHFALAASALLALLLGPFVLPAADRGLATLATVREELSPLAQHTEESGREEIARLRQTARVAGQSATASIHSLSDRLSIFIHENMTRRPQ